MLFIPAAQRYLILNLNKIFNSKLKWNKVWTSEAAICANIFQFWIVYLNVDILHPAERSKGDNL